MINLLLHDDIQQATLIANSTHYSRAQQSFWTRRHHHQRDC